MNQTPVIEALAVLGWPFRVIAVEGNCLAPTAQYEADTANVRPGQRFDVILPGREPGPR